MKTITATTAASQRNAAELGETIKQLQADIATLEEEGNNLYAQYSQMKTRLRELDQRRSDMLSQLHDLAVPEGPTMMWWSL